VQTFYSVLGGWSLTRMAKGASTGCQECGALNALGKLELPFPASVVKIAGCI